MKKKLLATAIAAALFAPTFAMAADPVAPAMDDKTAPSQTQQPAPEPAVLSEPGVNTGAIHFGADLNLTTSYFFRGYNQEDTGLIFQPNVYMTFNAFKSDDLNVDLKLGSWNSFHSEQTASDDAWYESDLYALSSVTYKGFSFNLGYTAYTYPGDAFDTIQEVGISTSYDDSKWWTDWGVDGFALKPSIGWYWEIEDGNGSEDKYLELGLYPSYTLNRSDWGMIGKGAITFPVILGMSTDGYYLDSDGHNEFFGYISGGATLSFPLGDVIPAKYGNWTCNVGGNYIQMLADSTEFANDGGENYEVQGFVGLSMTY